MGRPELTIESSSILDSQIQKSIKISYLHNYFDIPWGERGKEFLQRTENPFLMANMKACGKSGTLIWAES